MKTFQDDFVGGNDTLLADHAPLVGGNWVSTAGNITIEGNQAVNPENNVYATCKANAPSNLGQVSIKFDRADMNESSSALFVFQLYTPSGNHVDVTVKHNYLILQGVAGAVEPYNEYYAGGNFLPAENELTLTLKPSHYEARLNDLPPLVISRFNPPTENFGNLSLSIRNGANHAPKISEIRLDALGIRS